MLKWRIVVSSAEKMIENHYVTDSTPKPTLILGANKEPETRYKYEERWILEESNGLGCLNRINIDIVVAAIVICSGRNSI